MSDINTIKNLERNGGALRELVTQLKTRLGVLPFVGAGLSIPFGFKGWQEFLLSLAKSARRESEIKQRLRRGEYEEAAQDLLKALTHRLFQDALRDEFGDYKLEGAPLRGTVSYLPRLSSGPVITTNFDHVLERVFNDSGARFEEVVWGAKAEIAQRAIYQNKRYLLKLHGDVEDRTDRILTLKEYRRNYGSADPSKLDFKKPLPQLLQIILTDRPVLFLGCSLNQDRVVRLMKYIANTRPDLPHYAILEHPGQKAFPRMQRYYALHGIRPIWYPKGEHQCVEIIVRYLSEAIVEKPPKGTRQDVIAAGMKATETIEVLLRNHPEISSFFIVRYKDKLRLGERSDAGLADNPQLYLSQAAVHNNADDMAEEVPRERLTPDFWTHLFSQIKEEFVLAASSRVRLEDGSIAHIPMMDFKCAPSSENVDLAIEGFKKIGQTKGVLLNSGKSFHYYGFTLLNEEQWREFLGQSLLLSAFIDTRYVGHALINNECRLRISTTRLNPFIPTVVDTL